MAPVDQAPPLIEFIKSLPLWLDFQMIKHIASGVGAAGLAHLVEYSLLRRDVSYIKGKIDQLTSDHEQVRMSHEEVERLRRRLERLERKSKQAIPLSQPKQSLY